MKTILTSIVIVISCILDALAENPYFPVTKDFKMIMEYGKTSAFGKDMTFKSEATGETKEKNGKTYIVTKSWAETKDGKKKFQMETLSRVDAKSNVYSITPMTDKEQLALPSPDLLKKGYEWKTSAAGVETTSKVLSTSAELNHEEAKGKDLLLIEQVIDSGTKMKSYYKKGFGPFAVFMSTKEEGEKLMFKTRKP